MVMTYADIAIRKANTTLLMLDITLTRDSTTEILRLSDHDFRIIDESGSSPVHYQYVGAVQSWGRILSGFHDMTSEAYTQPTIAISLLEKKLQDQAIGHTLIDKLNAFYFIGALVEVFQTFEELGANAFSLRERWFKGKITSAPEISEGVVEINARAGVETDVLANKEITEAQHPDARPGDLGKYAPVLSGEVGGFDRSRAYLITPTNEQDFGDSAFSEAAALIDNGVPCPVCDFEDSSNLEVLVNSFRINSAQKTANKHILGCLWGGDLNSAGIIAGLTDSHVDEANGKIQIPVTNKSISIYRAFVPIADEAHVKTDTTYGGTPPFDDIDGAVSWSNWWRAFDREKLNTYAEQKPQDAPGTFEPILYTAPGVDFITPPPGGTLNGINTSASLAHIVWALVYVEKDPGEAHSQVVLIRCYDDGTGNGAYQTQTFEPTTDGFYLLRMDMTGGTLDVLNDIKAGTWGESVLDYFGIFGNDQYTTLLRVYLWGMGLRFDDCSVADALVAYERGEANPLGKASVLFRGWGNHSTSTPKDNPTDVLRELLTLGGEGPISSSDINLSSDHGGLAALETALDASMEETIGSGEIYHLAVREERKRSLAQILGSVMEQHFIQLWQSSKTGEFNAVMKSADLEVTEDWNGEDRILRAHNVRPRTFSAQLQDLEDIYTAFYLNFDLNSNTGAYQGRIFIDNTSRGVRDWRGYGTGDDSALLALASQLDDQQALFGRRVMTIEAPYIHDGKVAWNVLLRRMVFHMIPRVIMSCRVDGWAWDLEPGMVFLTDASFAAVSKYPGYVGSESGPSWANRKWYVMSVSKELGVMYPFEPVAINLD